LIATVVVGAVTGGNSRKAVSSKETSDGKISRSFAYGIRAIRRVGIAFMKLEVGSVQRQVAEDFVGADLVKTGDARFPGGTKKSQGTHEICFIEETFGVGSGQRTVNVGFGGKVDDRINFADLHYSINQIIATDVAMDKFVAGITLKIAKILSVTGVGEGIEIDDVVVGVTGTPEADEVGSDEAGAAGD